MDEDNIIVEGELPAESEAPEPEAGAALVSWIMDKVDSWRTHRDTQHAGRWDEYYKIWRGMCADAEKSKKSANRSKIVGPATMQAVDSTVAEIEEAIFGREQWIDLSEDYKEGDDKEQRDQMIALRDLLTERMERDGIPVACAKAFLTGAIYGTAVGKINTGLRSKDGQEEVFVELLPLEPYEFVPDPTTDDIDEMLGMAHETVIPYHKVLKGKREGYYRNVYCGAWEGERPGDSKDEHQKLPQGDCVFVTEWHGLVPAKFLSNVLVADGKQERDEEIEAILDEANPEDYLVEAIVTIANKGTLLKAQRNPFRNEDRCFIAYQHDRVPNYFWGRGVVEKGYNPQKALDAELRSRLDALGLVSHPMVAGDITRLPRGMNLTVYPGKFWPTTGDPREVLQPFNFGQLNQNTFPHAESMERMVQMATGAMDPNSFSGNVQSASNTAMNASAFIKRARRTMQNIERQWMRKLITKVMNRYMQFDPQEFPYDPNFCVKGTLGVMAREFEQQQLIQMLSIVPPESPMSLILMKAIFDNSSSPHKKDMVKAVDQFLAPPSEEQQAEQQEQKEMQKALLQAQLQEQQAKAQKAMAEAKKASALGDKALVEADMMDEEMAARQIEAAIDLREVQAFEMQNAISQMQQYLRSFEMAIKAKVAEAQIDKLSADASKIRAGNKEGK